MAVELMMARVAYKSYNGHKNSCCKSLGMYFQQAYCQPLESNEGLGHQEESPSCDRHLRTVPALRSVSGLLSITSFFL